MFCCSPSSAKQHTKILTGKQSSGWHNITLSSSRSWMVTVLPTSLARRRSLYPNYFSWGTSLINMFGGLFQLQESNLSNKYSQSAQSFPQCRIQQHWAPHMGHPFGWEWTFFSAWEAPCPNLHPTTQARKKPLLHGLQLHGCIWWHMAKCTQTSTATPVHTKARPPPEGT